MNESVLRDLLQGRAAKGDLDVDRAGHHRAHPEPPPTATEGPRSLGERRRRSRVGGGYRWEVPRSIRRAPRVVAVGGRVLSAILANSNLAATVPIS